MVQINNIFRSVVVDQQIINDRGIKRYVNLLKILADIVYIKDLSIPECSINVEEEGLYKPVLLHHINPDELLPEDANIFCFGKGEITNSNSDNFGPGLAPWHVADSFDEAIYVDRGSIILTKDPDVIEYLYDARADDWRAAVLMLAAAGVDVVLPPVMIEYLNDELAAEVKYKLGEERMEYLAAVAELGGASAARVAKKEYKDIKIWAQAVAREKIWPKAAKFNASMEKQDTKLLKRIGYKRIITRVPAIVSMMIAGNFPGAGAALFQTTSREIIRAINRPNTAPETHVHELIWYQFKMIDFLKHKEVSPHLKAERKWR